MREIIKIENVSKSFGKVSVLSNINVIFEEGKIHGLIGRNGSGKTMLMKCICGFVPVSSGQITIDGKILKKEVDFPENIGVIIETPGFLPSYSAYKNLKFLADIRGGISKREIVKAIDTVGLDPNNKMRVGKYSLGMRQRLGLAQAIMEDPKILILDEPMNGLDNDGAVEMREYLLNLKARGKTILIASHFAGDIDALCDTVHEMEHGVLKTVRIEKV